MSDTETKEEPSPTSEKTSEPGDKTTTDDTMLEKIESSVRKVLGKLLDSGQLTVEEKTTPTSPTEQDKPPTPKEEERTMEEMVEQAVAKLKEKTPEKEPEKSSPSPETQPQTLGRKIEERMWGIK